MIIDPELHHGRPAQQRSDREMRCYDILDRLGLEYERADHEFAFTIEVCHEVEKVLGCGICKNLLLTNRQMTDVYLLMMPGDKPFKTKVLSKQIGSARLSFASGDQMLKYLDITPGSLSVLGLMNDSENRVRLLIDSELLKEKFTGCHPCVNSSTLKIRTEDILKVFIPAVKHEPTFVELPWETD